MEKKSSIIVEAVDRASKPIAGINDKLKSLGDYVKSSAFVGMATIFAGIGGSALALASSFQNFANKAMEAEEKTAKLEGALMQAGTYTKEAMEQAEGYATALSRISTEDDDAIKGAEALLIRFARLSGEGLEQATKATLDFSAVTGKDLNTSAMIVGKTISSNTNFLKKYGIEVDGAKGSSERLTSVIEQLNLKMGGEASNLASTTIGQYKQMKNEIDNLEESIGGGLLPIYKELLSTIKETAIYWTDAMPDSKKTKGYYQDIINDVNLQIKKLQESSQFKNSPTGFIANDIEKLKEIAIEAQTEITKIETEENRKRLTALRQAKAQEVNEREQKDADEREKAKTKTKTLNEIEKNRQQTKIKDEELAQKQIETVRDLDLSEQIERYQKLITNAKLSGDRRLDIETKIINLMIERRKKLEREEKPEITDGRENTNSDAYIEAYKKRASAIEKIIKAQKNKNVELTKEELEEINNAVADYANSEAENRTEGRQKLWNDLLELEKSGVGTLADIGKAFAVFDIGIKTYQAIMNAYAQLGPILGTGAAVMLTALGVDQANKVTGSTLKFAQGGSFVTDGATNIPMSNGRTATVGEAGAERIDVTPIRDSNRRSSRRSQTPTQINLQINNRTFAKVVYDANKRRERGIY